MYSLNHSDRLCGWGADESGSLEVCVEYAGWVIDVRLNEGDARLRSRDALARALREAYRNGVFANLLNRSLVEGDVEAKAARGQELLDGRRRIQAPQLRRWVPIDRPSGPIDSKPPCLPPGLSRGQSRDRELTVGVWRNGGFAEITVDATWLRLTDSDTLRFALKEAFVSARHEGAPA